MKIKDSKNAAILFGCILFMCSWALFMVHYRLIELWVDTKAALLDTLLDSLFVSALYFFIPRNRRRVICVVFAILTVVFEINVLYYRNFHALPGVDALFSGNPFNTFTIAAAIDSFRLTDTLIMFTPLAVLIASYGMLNSKTICAWRLPAVAVIFAATAFITAPFFRAGMSIRRHYYWAGGGEYTSLNDFFEEKLQLLKNPVSNVATLEEYGFAPYLWNVAASVIPRTKRLDQSDIALIRSALPSRTYAPNDSAVGFNLVIIIVESLNSTILQTGVTPCLDRLIASEGTLAAFNLQSQIDLGGSSDGQFIINTGLLPLSGEALISHFADNDYPSIAKSLKGHASAEVIAEDSRVWNHNITSRSFGYDRIIDNVATGKLDCDSILFAECENIVSTLQQPFLLEITTIGMHSPYSVAKTSALPVEAADNRARNYLSAASALDKALCGFINKLIRLGIYDNTIIAVTGDHPAPASAMAPELVSQTVPLIIANAGVTKQITDTASQIDIFPTLLDIAGVRQRYRGVGHSLLADTVISPTPNARKASELIIRSRTSADFLENL